MEELYCLYNKSKYVLLTLLIISFSIYSRFTFTNDIPQCPHAVHLPKEIRPYGCIGHKAESIDLASLKSGDIVLISYGGARTIFSSIFYNSIWLHSGLVYIDKITGEIYIFEAASYYPPYNSEVVKIPILKWMKINRNVKAVIIPINKEISQEAFDKVLNKFENVKVMVESIGHTWIRFLRTKKLCSLPDNHLFSTNFNNTSVKMGKVFNITCNELTVASLQEAGVMELELTPSSYLPNNLYNRMFKCINGYGYGEPHQVSFHEYVGSISNSINY